VSSTVRRLTVALAVPAALLLAGCGTPQAGAAAVVGDRRIAVSEVQEAYRDITVLVGQDLQATQADMLTFLIIEPYLTEAAAEAGQGVSEDDARMVFAEVKDRLPNPSPGALQVARAVAARERISSTLEPSQVEQVFGGIIEEIRADEVKVNPRYGGTFDYNQLVIMPGGDDWLRQPEPSQPSGPGQPEPGQQPPADGSAPGQPEPGQPEPGEAPAPGETLPGETPAP
jgi:hypothetical protein